MNGRAAAIAAWVAVGLVGMAADANADGDAGRGKVIAYTCHGCHGVPDYKNAFPNYSVPKLGGQNSQYLINALNEYAGGDRAHQTMHSQAATLSDQDRADVAAYLQSEVVQPNKEVVGTPPTATQTCVSCHGTDGAKTIALLLLLRDRRTRTPALHGALLRLLISLHPPLEFAVHFSLFLSYSQGRRDLNPQPPVLETGALPN